MSSIEQKSTGNQEKTGSTTMNASQIKLPYRQYTSDHYGKLSTCGHLVKKCLGEEVRPSAGLCMIAFAVPLIVPGITLTVVAFEDQTGFPKYGALHVLGMTLLGLAALLIVSGIVLNTRSRPRIASDDVQLMESTHGKSAKDFNSCTTSNVEEYRHTRNETTSGFIPSLPSYGSAAKMADDSTERYQEFNYTTAEMNTYSDTGQKRVVFSTRKGSKRKYSTSKSFEECSSSFDSFDSDDFSSGSYILSEDIEGQKSAQVFDSTMGYIHENDDVRLFSTFKPNPLKKQAFSFDNIIGDYIVNKSSIVALPSVDNQAVNLQDAGKDVVMPSHGNFGNKMEVIFDDCDKLPVKTLEDTKLSSAFNFELPVEASSPGSRQRLHGLSSEVFTASSDILTRSSDSVKTQDVVSNENISASSSSVFSLELAVKSVKDTAHCDRTQVFTQDTKSQPLKTWAQSPTASRPHSFPCGGGISELSAAVVRIQSLNDTYITSMGEFSR